MTGRRAIVGLCMLCALVVSAFAAQGASAAFVVTCAPVTEGAETTKGFKDAHCKEAVGNGTTGGKAVKFEHKEFIGQTAISGSNILTGTERAVTKLKSVQAGVTLELQSKVLSGSGLAENSGGSASGTGVIEYKEVSVTAPAGKGCVVKGGAVTTEKLAATAAGLTQQLKFTPAAGAETAFAKFTVEGCSIAALNHVYEAKGSVTGDTVGATTNFTHVKTTEQKTLTLSGQNAGIEGTLTITNTATGSGLALTP